MAGEPENTTQENTTALAIPAPEVVLAEKAQALKESRFTGDEERNRLERDVVADTFGLLDSMRDQVATIEPVADGDKETQTADMAHIQRLQLAILGVVPENPADLLAQARDSIANRGYPHHAQILESVETAIAVASRWRKEEAVEQPEQVTLGDQGNLGMDAVVGENVQEGAQLRDVSRTITRAFDNGLEQMQAVKVVARTVKESGHEDAARTFEEAMVTKAAGDILGEMKDTEMEIDDDTVPGWQGTMRPVVTVLTREVLVAPTVEAGIQQLQQKLHDLSDQSPVAAYHYERLRERVDNLVREIAVRSGKGEPDVLTAQEALPVVIEDVLPDIENERVPELAPHEAALGLFNRQLTELADQHQIDEALRQQEWYQEQRQTIEDELRQAGETRPREARVMEMFEQTMRDMVTGIPQGQEQTADGQPQEVTFTEEDALAEAGRYMVLRDMVQEIAGRSAITEHQIQQTVEEDLKYWMRKAQGPVEGETLSVDEQVQMEYGHELRVLFLQNAVQNPDRGITVETAQAQAQAWVEQTMGEQVDPDEIDLRLNEQALLELDAAYKAAERENDSSNLWDENSALFQRYSLETQDRIRERLRRGEMPVVEGARDWATQRDALFTRPELVTNRGSDEQPHLVLNEQGAVEELLLEGAYNRYLQEEIQRRYEATPEKMGSMTALTEKQRFGLATQALVRRQVVLEARPLTDADDEYFELQEIADQRVLMQRDERWDDRYRGRGEREGQVDLVWIYRQEALHALTPEELQVRRERYRYLTQARVTSGDPDRSRELAEDLRMGGLTREDFMQEYRLLVAELEARTRAARGQLRLDNDAVNRLRQELGERWAWQGYGGESGLGFNLAMARGDEYTVPVKPEKPEEKTDKQPDPDSGNDPKPDADGGGKDGGDKDDGKDKPGGDGKDPDDDADDSDEEPETEVERIRREFLAEQERLQDSLDEAIAARNRLLGVDETASPDSISQAEGRLDENQTNDLRTLNGRIGDLRLRLLNLGDEFENRLTTGQRRRVGTEARRRRRGPEFSVVEFYKNKTEYLNRYEEQFFDRLFSLMSEDKPFSQQDYYTIEAVKHMFRFDVTFDDVQAALGGEQNVLNLSRAEIQETSDEIRRFREKLRQDYEDHRRLYEYMWGLNRAAGLGEIGSIYRHLPPQAAADMLTKVIKVRKTDARPDDFSNEAYEERAESTPLHVMLEYQKMSDLWVNLQHIVRTCDERREVAERNEDTRAQALYEEKSRWARGKAGQILTALNAKANGNMVEFAWDDEHLTPEMIRGWAGADRMNAADLEAVWTQDDNIQIEVERRPGDNGLVRDAVHGNLNRVAGRLFSYFELDAQRGMNISPGQFFVMRVVMLQNTLLNGARQRYPGRDVLIEDLDPFALRDVTPECRGSSFLSARGLQLLPNDRVESQAEADDIRSRTGFEVEVGKRVNTKYLTFLNACGMTVEEQHLGEGSRSLSVQVVKMRDDEDAYEDVAVNGHTERVHRVHRMKGQLVAQGVNEQQQGVHYGDNLQHFEAVRSFCLAGFDNFLSNPSKDKAKKLMTLANWFKGEEQDKQWAFNVRVGRNVSRYFEYIPTLNWGGLRYGMGFDVEQVVTNDAGEVIQTNLYKARNLAEAAEGPGQDVWYPGQEVKFAHELYDSNLIDEEGMRRLINAQLNMGRGHLVLDFDDPIDRAFMKVMGAEQWEAWWRFRKTHLNKELPTKVLHTAGYTAGALGILGAKGIGLLWKIFIR